jgi:hypothetical protein
MAGAVVLFQKSSLARSVFDAPSAAIPPGSVDTFTRLPDSSLVAAVVLAVHRGLIAEREREYLPLHVSE